MIQLSLAQSMYSFEITQGDQTKIHLSIYEYDTT